MQAAYYGSRTSLGEDFARAGLSRASSQHHPFGGALKMPSLLVSVAIGQHAGGGLLLAALASLHDVQALCHGRCCYHGQP